MKHSSMCNLNRYFPLSHHSFHEDGLKIGEVRDRYVAGPGFREDNVKQISMEAHDSETQLEEGQSSPWAQYSANAHRQLERSWQIAQP